MPGSRTETEATTEMPRSLREYVTTTVINTVPPLVAYYALRAFGITPYLALVGAISVAVAQGLINMVRHRKLEPTNLLMIAAATCSLTIAFTTKNPRVVQVIELIPITAIVLSTVVSGVLRKPTSKKVASIIVPGLADDALPERGWTARDISDWQRLHSQICLWLGLLCGVFPAAGLVFIFAFPVDISIILINTVGPTLVVLSLAVAITLLRRFVRQRDRTAAERPVEPAAAP